MTSLQSGLTINQRNLLLYYLNHKKKHGDKPCHVPRFPSQVSRFSDYLRAMERLEERGLLRIERNSDNYLSWTIVDAKS